MRLPTAADPLPREIVLRRRLLGLCRRFDSRAHLHDLNQAKGLDGRVLDLVGDPLKQIGDLTVELSDEVRVDRVELRVSRSVR